MDIIITENRLLPVTNDQSSAFKIWAVEKYGNFHAYIDACRTQTTVDVYIRANILSEEMKAILCESEPLMDNIATDLHDKRLQQYNKKIITKINYTKMKLGEMAFADEVRELRRQRVMERMRTGIENTHYIIPWNTHFMVKKIMTETECYGIMNDVCAICLEKHPMMQVCETSCKHQFGKECISKWKSKSCPVCRSAISQATPIYEYV
jgi:hypothetical protein